MTLRVRIALILAVVAFGVGAFAALTSYLSTAGRLQAAVDDGLRSRAAEVNDADDPDRDERGDRDGRGRGDRGSDDRCPSAGALQPASAAQLVTESGVVVPCIAGGVELPVDEADRTIPDGTVVIRTVAVDGDDLRILSTPWHAGGTLQIARDLAETESVIDQLRLQLLVLVALATAVAAGLGWVVASRVVRPIVALRDTTHRIATTLDLATPIDTDAPGEVGELAASFATMVGAVARSEEQQRRLVSDASHEMRTPLTSLRSNVELLGRIERLPEGERAEVVADVLADVDELASLLGELVDLASDLARAEPTEPVRLDDLARTVAARTERRSTRPVSVVVDGPVEVPGRARQLERAIANLVDNSIKYSPAGAPIEVRVDAATVTVADRGRGIPAEDLERVFDRFHRAVDVRTEPGSGLGLAIVAEIVRGHGGRVFARNRDGGGAEVGFELPSPGPPAPR